MEGFKKFLLRGNVVDLAVAVVIGAAFGAIVTSFTAAFITPLISVVTGAAGRFADLYACVGGPCTRLDDGTFDGSGTVFPYGQFIQAVISFVIVASVVYFLVVTPMQRLLDRFATEPEPSDPVKACPECLSTIPEAARRCAFCTTEQPPVVPVAP